MSTTDLKKKIIEEINDMDNEALLLEVYQLLEIENEGATLYLLSDDQISVVNESQEQVRNGKLIKEEDANKEIDEWLEK